jgi:hypothetical protein
MLGLSAAAWLGALSFGAAAPDVEPLPSAPAPAALSVVLEWSAPARCPSASAVQQRLTRALADSAADPRGLRARASVTEDDSGALTLALALDRDDGPVGRRTMQAGDCDELATAAVLIVALAVDPDAKLEDPLPDAGDPSEDGIHVPPEPEPPPQLEPRPEPEREPQPDPRTPPDPPPQPDPPTPRDSEPRPPTLHAGLRLGAGAGLSVLPGATAVISAAAATWGRAWRAELGASYWTPVETRPGDGPVGGRIQQWTLDARGCGLLRPGPLELPLCAGLDVGAVHGKGVGVAAPRHVASLRLAFTAGAALVWRPARWNQRVGPWIGADLLVAVVRARFRATPAAPGLVYHTPPLGGRVAAGIEVRFR